MLRMDKARPFAARYFDSLKCPEKYIFAKSIASSSIRENDIGIEILKISLNRPQQDSET